MTRRKTIYQVTATDLSEMESFDVHFFATSNKQARSKAQRYFRKAAKENNASLSDLSINHVIKKDYRPIIKGTEVYAEEEYKRDYNEAQKNEKFLRR